MSNLLSIERSNSWARRTFHRIRMPRHIDEVTSIDATGEVDAREVGLEQSQALSIWRAVEALYQTGYYPAVVFCLRRHGKIVFNRAIGHVRGNGPDDDIEAPKVLARTTTPSCIFSASKALSAMVVHRLAETGALNLLDPICHYIPEFAQGGKQTTSIYHLLSHRAGIPGMENVSDPRLIFDHEGCLEQLCAAEPRHPSGRQQAYHALTGGVIMNELVRRVAGMDIRKAWRLWFKEPLGLLHCDYGVAPRYRSAVCKQALTGLQNCSLVDTFMRRAIGGTLAETMQILDFPEFHTAVIPAANIFATAEELSRFYQMLLDGGEWQGQQILKPVTVQRATAEVGPHVFDRTLGMPMRFSQGFMLGGDPVGIFGPRTHHAFGHLGLVNNLSWADPGRGISVALLVSGIPLIASNLGALLRLLITISRACPRII